MSKQGICKIYNEMKEQKEKKNEGESESREEERKGESFGSRKEIIGIKEEDQVFTGNLEKNEEFLLLCGRNEEESSESGY